MNTIAGWQARLTQALAGLSESAILDAQVLLAHVLGKPRAWILAHLEAGLSSEQEEKLSADLERLKSGLPLPYVLGHWEFYGLDFIVSPAVLIPRPETELLVDQALSWLAAHPIARRAIDIGTGSGCIAVSLAVHIPDLQLVATDLSPRALEIAHRNAEHHEVAERIEFIQADILDIASQADSLTGNLIVANLPYIPTKQLHTLPVYTQEPALALDGGPDGLSLIRRLLEQAPSWLAPEGLLLMEIEASQGARGCSLAHAAFPDADIQLLKDLAGHDRLLWIEIQV